MNIQIKSEYKSSYPTKIHAKPLQFISASIHPAYNTWFFLVMAPDGEFYSVDRKHAKQLSKLEDVLK